MVELRGHCLGGREGSQSLLGTRSPEAQEGGGLGGRGEADPSAAHWDLGNKGQFIQKALSLLVSSLRMSFSLFWGCVCLSRTEISVFREGRSLSSGVEGSQ